MHDPAYHFRNRGKIDLSAVRGFEDKQIEHVGMCDACGHGDLAVVRGILT